MHNAKEPKHFSGEKKEKEEVLPLVSNDFDNSFDRDSYGIKMQPAEVFNDNSFGNLQVMNHNVSNDYKKKSTPRLEPTTT